METEHKNLKELTLQDCKDLLTRNAFGHLGCATRDETYVTPITYVYDGDFIYGHSLLGKKIEMMRSNPHVCIQVEEIKSLFNWKSVVVQGRFEELKEGLAPMQALRLLKMKISDLERDRGVTPLEFEIDAILSHARIYRIKIEKMTGRSEQK